MNGKRITVQKIATEMHIDRKTVYSMLSCPRVRIEFAEEGSVDPRRLTEFLKKWDARFREMEEAAQKETDTAA